MTDRLPDADLVELFLSGQCASFAIAAARALAAAGGRRVGICVLIDPEGDPNTPDDRCAVHAYASCDGIDRDASGVRTPEGMADAFGLASWETDGPFPPDEFAAFFAGDDGLDVDDHWTGVAADLIARRPELLMETAS